MKLSEFIALPEDHKRLTVFKESVAIAKRELPDKLDFLFQLNEYYIEAFCCCKTNEVLEYRVFFNTEQLAPYLEDIRIDQLLN